MYTEHPLKRRLMGGHAANEILLDADVSPLPDEPFASFGGTTAAPPQSALLNSAELDAMSALASCDESEERNALILELDSVRRRTQRFLEEQVRTKRAALEARLDVVLSEGRAALERYNALRAEANALEGPMHARQEEVGKARMDLLKAEGDRPGPEEWPTAAELSAADRRIAKAQAKLDEVAAEYATAQQQVALKRAEQSTAQRTLKSLESERDDLRAQLAGQPRKGPHGLQAPGGAR